MGIVASVLAFAAATASAERTIGTPYIQAHRGGAVVNGEPTYPENTMPAFRHSAAEGFVLEMDVKLTRDRVPVIIHDATLNRTTDCTGQVASKTLAQLRHCRVDILGSEGNSRHINPDGTRSASIPTLTHVLDFIKHEGAQASIEIKNVPTDPDFDPTDEFATIVSRAIRSSGVPQSQLIVQSFWPPNLTVAQRILPDAELSFLTLSAANTGGITYASTHGIQWVSPQWPVNATYIADAHAQGREIVPYTVDRRSDMVAAADDGVDAIITNDPTRARRVFHKTAPAAPPVPPAPSKADCRGTNASLHAPPIKNLDPAPGAPRVFAMQFKQDVANVATYGTFRTKIECMIRRYVVPHLAKNRPNIVAFNEDVGLMTLGTGSRGDVARQTIGHPDSVPNCQGKPAPCVAAVALTEITSAYAQQVSAYRARFPDIGALAQSFVAPTDTFARGWMQTFSDMARRYDIYIVGSNTQAAVPGVARPVRDRDVQGPRRRRPEVRLRRDRADGLQPGLHVGPAHGQPGGATAAAQRGRKQPEGASDIVRGDAAGVERALGRPRRAGQPEAVPHPPYEGEGRLRHQPSGLPVRLRLRRLAARDEAVCGHRCDLHAVPLEARAPTS